MSDPTPQPLDDIVIELKVRLSGLTYEQAGKLRDLLRQPDDISMEAIVDELLAVAEDIAPDTKIEAFAPWAEWRPARGRRQKPVIKKETT